MRRAASPEDAADVLSETYLIAWRKLKKIPPGDSARLWLFGVAANVLRGGFKRHRSSEALVEQLASEPQDTVQIEPAGREDQTTRALRAGLASLTALDRDILTLTAWEGLSPSRSPSSPASQPTSSVCACTEHAPGSSAGSPTFRRLHPRPTPRSQAQGTGHEERARPARTALAELLPHGLDELLSHRDSVEDASLAQIVHDQSLERRVGVRALFFEPAFDEVRTTAGLPGHVSHSHHSINPLAK
jgi:hypothetical protein